MTRRALFRALCGAAAAPAIAFDPERSLWTPGAKLISIPPPPVVRTAQILRVIRHYDPVTQKFYLDVLYGRSLPSNAEITAFLES